jgi:hypothetical protein
MCAMHTCISASQDGYEIMWIETLSDDEVIVKTHMQQLQDSSPDFLSQEVGGVAAERKPPRLPPLQRHVEVSASH